jgi:hypothetical protein
MAVQAPSEEADNKKALTDFVMDNDDLVKLEGLLGRFNIFRVLRASHHEIRHSNMLAWLLDPAETHGLGDRFIRRWLMEVLHDAAATGGDFGNLPSPIEVDALDVEYVEVVRESANIDLLLHIRTDKGATWVICIENKVKSVQGKKQLEGYRAHVERRYPNAERTLFVFLTMADEEPNDPKWIPSTYSVVESVLRRCLEERGEAIGHEPHLLMTQYLNLLAEDFVDETESAVLARKIYQKHKRAIDFILDNLDDPISNCSGTMQEVLAANAIELGIVMGVSHKGYTRFLPKEWDVQENRGGTAWGPNSRVVACEVYFWAKNKKVELHICVARAPNDWADAVWARAANPPFKQEWKKRPSHFIKPYKVRSDISVEVLSEMEPNDARKFLLDWIRDEINAPQFRQAVEVIRSMLPSLKVV